MGMDSEVQATNDDAQLSKLSCVNKGYFKDEFVHYFVKKPTKRPPLINRGYFTRHSAIRGLIHQFLSKNKHQHNQIISIGAGFDTAWFQLTKDTLITNTTKYIELDFTEVCQKKAAIISQHQELSSLLQSHTINLLQGIITSPTYNLHPADIRALDTIQKTLEQHCDPSLPTLIIAECVLVYVPPDHSNALISWLATNFTSNASIIIYDPIRPNDAFGRQMLINLEARGCPLLGISHAPTPEAQCQRLKTAGWTRAECMDLYQVHNQCLDKDCRLKAEKLEPLDEFEEWTLLMQHYCLVVGNKGTADLQLLSSST